MPPNLPALPRPTNQQSAKLLQRVCNTLALKPTRTCRSLHHCCFCGADIVIGDTYRDGGYSKRAHDECFKQMARPVETLRRVLS